MINAAATAAADDDDFSSHRFDTNLAFNNFLSQSIAFYVHATGVVPKKNRDTFVRVELVSNYSKNSGNGRPTATISLAIHRYWQFVSTPEQTC